MEPLVISYLRFSRPEQMEGDSKRRQNTAADDWCKRNGKQLAERLEDLGISAFRGAHANAGALSGFLVAVRAGRVPRGSILLVEELDRLSRQEPEEALTLFLEIIRAGVVVVTLNHGEDRFEKGKLDMPRLMTAVMKLCVAHFESLKKSQRLGEAWKEKRRRIAERPLTRMIPAWLEIKDGKIVERPAIVAAVRKLYALAIDGHGLTALMKRYNAEIEGFGRVKHFTRSYVAKILKSRAVLGEFQPHRLVYDANGKKGRTPIGDMIKDYYPAIVEEQTFYAVQEKMKQRRSSGGPQAEWINIFLGIVYHAQDGTHLQIQDKGYGRRLTSAGAIEGRRGAAAYVALPLKPFEQAFLMVMARHVMPRFGQATAADQTELLTAQAKLTEAEERIAEIQAAVTGDMRLNTASVVTMLATLDAQRDEYRARVRELKAQDAARTVDQAAAVRTQLWTTIKRMDAGSLTNDERVKLREIIRHIVTRIDVAPARNGKHYSCAVAIALSSGDAIRYTLTLTHQDRMRRNALGHPIKSQHAKADPDYNAHIVGPEWTAYRAPSAGKTFSAPRDGGRWITD